MSVMAHTQPRQIHLTRAAHFAGEAFGYDPLLPGTGGQGTSSGPMRSALAAVIIACLLTAAYLAI
jgi:hypothetical protein